MFGDPPIDFEPASPTWSGSATYGKVRSRVGDLPEVLGALPASVMAKEITTPGEGQIRALFVSAGNPVLSVPNGEELEAAIGGARPLRRDRPLRHRHRPPLPTTCCPATTFLEREDFPLPFLAAVHAPRSSR